MAFARPKADANGEFMHQRYTELSDVIRARNKREDRLLNVRVKFYEREKNIRLNIIRKEQCQLERVRTSLFEDANKIQLKKQNLALPGWLSARPKSKGQIVQLSTSEFTPTDWEFDSSLTQSGIVLSNTTDNTRITGDMIRRHSAR